MSQCKRLINRTKVNRKGMSRRGRKVNTSRPDSGSILKYFSAETSPFPTTVVKAIIENIVDQAFVVVTSHESSKKHDFT